MTEERHEAPAYVPWKTFMTATEQLGSGLPPRLDASVFQTHSGSTRNWILATFRFLGLTEANGTVRPALRSWVEDSESRPEAMKAILHEKYPDLLSLAQQNATPKQMRDAFTEMGLSGSTHRKAITFFLKACDFSGIQVPESWKKANSTASTAAKSTGSRRRRAAPKTEPQPSADGSSEERSGDADSVQLESGGTITLSVDANMMRMSQKDREWLFALIDKFQSYSSEGEGTELEDE